MASFHGRPEARRWRRRFLISEKAVTHRSADHVGRAIPILNDRREGAVAGIVPGPSDPAHPAACIAVGRIKIVENRCDRSQSTWVPEVGRYDWVGGGQEAETGGPTGRQFRRVDMSGIDNVES